MAIGANWKEIWDTSVWDPVWTTTPSSPTVRVRYLPTWYYQPASIPFDAPRWLKQELDSISRATYGAAPVVQFQELHVAPSKPRAGMVALADGTDWNPGSGAGFYGYYGSAWVKLG